VSLRSDGKYRCDRCDLELENGGVQECASITDLDPSNPGNIRHFHLCYDRLDPESGKVAHRGCRDRVLTKRALRAYLALEIIL